jgi:protein-disulfide isomerase
LLWLAVAALFLLNAGTIAYLVLGNKSQADPHGHDEPMVDVPIAELLQPGPLADMSIGDPNAPNVVVEYASMTCPHCANFHQKLFPELKSKYVDTGKARFIFREFPLDKLAALASMVARCSGADGYFPMIESLFKSQESWARAEDPMAKLSEVAKQGGFSQEKFDQCVEDQALFDKIVQVRKGASESFKVNSTPSFFVNGKPLEHPEGVEDFAALLE